MSLPPPRKLKRSMQPVEAPSDTGNGLWCYCAYCGKGVLIAFGYNALAVTRAKQLRVLAAKGWEVAPRFRCNVCIEFGNTTLHNTI